jgi:hypothetical protein
MVAWTAPKSNNAPVPVLRLEYAKEKGTAYRNNRVAEAQEGATGAREDAPTRTRMASVPAPASSRTAEKLAGSMTPRLRARRQSTEFAAKAMRARAV